MYINNDNNSKTTYEVKHHTNNMYTNDNTIINNIYIYIHVYIVYTYMCLVDGPSPATPRRRSSAAGGSGAPPGAPARRPGTTRRRGGTPKRGEGTAD